MRWWLIVWTMGLGVACSSKSEDALAADMADPVDDTSAEIAADTDADSDADAGSDTASDEDTSSCVDASPPYNEANFRATHNSYSGEERGSIRDQLANGIRQIELDFHDNDFGVHGYRIGHSSVGSEVDLTSPNPSTLALPDWLEVVAVWSDENPEHTPVHVLLNIKDDMTDNRHTSEGSFAALNQVVLDAFGDRLFWARSLEDSWPTVNDLRGKIIVGLTGQETTASRRAYVRDRGESPAVAMNDHGQVIEVHKSESHGTLWYWTGQMQEDGTIIWKHHGRYDDGRDPAIALNNHGWFVEIHRSQTDDDLWSWVGHIGPDGDLHFGENTEFDTGRIPSIRFTDREGWDLKEVHLSSSKDDQNWYWDVTLDAGESRVLWGTHGRSDDERFDSASASSSAGTVTVSSEDIIDDDTLVYDTDDFTAGLVRYSQLAFIDTSPGDPEVLSGSSDFRSFPSGSHADASTWRSRGGIARMWKFDEDDASAMLLPPQFAATDTPFEDWYVSWGESVGAYD